MTFLIISHTPHHAVDNQLYAYAPYVREMNIWLKYVDKVQVVAPVSKKFDAHINLAYQHNNIKLKDVPAFSLLGFKEQLKTILKLPKILSRLYKAMKQADHIHLRCPGNIGLMGCFTQILFPKTPKTTKYAGNWDPKAKQPWSYNLQKWILKNTLLTKNNTVLVYGQWPKQTHNIKPFFTASYHDSEKENLFIRNYTRSLHFCFVGTLSSGKQPALALELVHQLRKNKIDAVLHIYGDGELKENLEKDIKAKKGNDWTFVYGNQPQSQIKKALKYSHFLILPTQSEGWPKAVAEAMFWGCIPIVTPISCIPWMLDKGQRGLLMKPYHLEFTIKNIISLRKTPKTLENMALEAAKWSRVYTLDKFEEEIFKLY